MNRPRRSPRPGSLADYAEKVVRYRAEYESGQRLKNGDPPVVAELLLSLLIEVRTLGVVGRVALGLLLFALLRSFF